MVERPHTPPPHLHPQLPKLRLCLRGEAVCQKEQLLASTPERAGGTGGCFSFSVKQCRGFTDTALLHSPERQTGSRKSGPHPGASPSAAPAYRGRVNASRPGPGFVRKAVPGSSPVPQLRSRIPAPTPWAVTGCKGGKRPGAAHLVGLTLLTAPCRRRSKNVHSFCYSDCRPSLRPLHGGAAGDVQQNAHLAQQHHQRGAPRAEKGQADAGVGDGVGHHADV